MTAPREQAVNYADIWIPEKSLIPAVWVIPWQLVRVNVR